MDDNIKSFEFRCGFLNHPLIFRDDADIALDDDSVNTMVLCNFVSHALGAVFALVIIDGDVAAFGSEFLAYEGTQSS